jgi:hypothetical protein
MKLFICFTPLHVLISHRIIEEEKIDKYIFVYMVDFNNAKNTYYFDKLAARAEESFYIILKKKFFKDIKTIYALSRKLQKFQSLIYYSGKIKSSHNRLLMFLTKYKSFVTFDDGSGNISGDGYFYNPNENIVFKFFFRIFNSELLYKNILINHHLHYTIFNFPNVFSNSKQIQLFKKIHINEIKEKSKLVILLTNAFSEDGEMTLKEEKILYDQIIKDFKVTHFIRHPRQQINKINESMVKELKSNKISEELIIDLNNKYDITLIGIYSTVLLNLINNYDVKLINIQIPLKKPTKFLDTIMKNISIKI